MSLNVDPSELMFEEPADGSSSVQILSFGNPHDELVAFKVKTTAPKRYCVRPNLGVIAPKSRQDVHVIFQPRKPGEPKEPGRVHRDKFLIESHKIFSDFELEDSDGKLTSEQWAKIADGREKQAAHYKMKCSFTEVTEDAGTPSHVEEMSPVEPGLTRRQGSDVKSSSNSDVVELETKLHEARAELRRLREAAVSRTSSTKSTYSIMHMLIVAILFLIVGIVIGINA